ncbi:hypothetical protein Efla_007762 [Eimeria flavescens]
MGILSWLKAKTKREKKPRKPPELPTPRASKRAEEEEDDLATKQVVRYPLYDPRHVSPRGSELPLLDQRLSKQLSLIPAEMGSKEGIAFPCSMSNSQLSAAGTADEPDVMTEATRLEPLRGDFSPLSGTSLEAAFQQLNLKRQKTPQPQQQQQQLQRQETVPPPSPAPPPPRPSPPSSRPSPSPSPPPASRHSSPAPSPPHSSPLPSPPRSPPAAPAAAPAEVAPLPPPEAPLPAPVLPVSPKPKPSSSSSSSSSSSVLSRRSSRSSKKAASSRSSLPSVTETTPSDESLSIEDMPTAPTTPRAASRALERSKQPRLLLLQPCKQLSTCMQHREESTLSRSSRTTLKNARLATTQTSLTFPCCGSSSSSSSSSNEATATAARAAAAAAAAEVRSGGALQDLRSDQGFPDEGRKDRERPRSRQTRAGLLCVLALPRHSLMNLLFFLLLAALFPAGLAV